MQELKAMKGRGATAQLAGCKAAMPPGRPARGRVAVRRHGGADARAGLGGKRRGQGAGGAPADPVAAQAESRIREDSRATPACWAQRQIVLRLGAKTDDPSGVHGEYQFTGHRRSDPDRGRPRRRHARSRGIERRHPYHRQLGRQVRGGRLGGGRPHERRRFRPAAVRSEAAGGGAGGAAAGAPATAATRLRRSLPRALPRRRLPAPPLPAATPWAASATCKPASEPLPRGVDSSRAARKRNPADSSTLACAARVRTARLPFPSASSPNFTMTQSKLKRGLQTRIVRAEDQLTPGFESFSMPVTRASTVVFPDLATMRALDWKNDAQWRYGLHATPTSLALAQRLAAIEGGNHALLQPSGLSSISNVYFGLVKAGDDVLIPDNVYSPNRDHGDWLARDFGVTVRYYDPMIGAGIADLIQPNTRLIWLEAPGSVTMEVADVPAITAVGARAQRRHGDRQHVVGGARVSAVRSRRRHLGAGAHEVSVGRRRRADGRDHHRRSRTASEAEGGAHAHGDRRLVGRLLADPAQPADHASCVSQQHDRAALALATWLKTRPEIAAVLHPAIADCPGHEFYKRDFTGGGRAVFGRVRRPLQRGANRHVLRVARTLLASAGAGAARTASRCRTTWRRCAPPGSGRIAARWCGSISASKTRRICARISSRRWRTRAGLTLRSTPCGQAARRAPR